MASCSSALLGSCVSLDDASLKQWVLGGRRVCASHRLVPRCSRQSGECGHQAPGELPVLRLSSNKLPIPAADAVSEICKRVLVAGAVAAPFLQTNFGLASQEDLGLTYPPLPDEILNDTSFTGALQFTYLGMLFAVVATGAFLVVRALLTRRELDFAAKELVERATANEATPREYFELGAILVRKNMYPVARKYLEQAVKRWEDDEQDLAPVYNAVAFSYFKEKKLDKAIHYYQKALTLSPGYTIGWNNLAQAYKEKKQWEDALKTYRRTLEIDPDNKQAKGWYNFCLTKLEEEAYATTLD